MDITIHIPDSYPEEMKEKARIALDGKTLFVSHHCEDDDVSVMVVWNTIQRVPTACVERQMDGILDRMVDEERKDIINEAIKRVGGSSGN